jgi:hypothetical protein
VYRSTNLPTKLDQAYRDFDLATKGGIILNPKVDKIKDTIQWYNDRKNPKNISANSSIHSDKTDQEGQVLNTSRCPTPICSDCTRLYHDRLNLGITIICNCSCHHEI